MNPELPGLTSRAVTIEDNTVSDYQKNGITLTGLINGTVIGNAVTGDGPINYIAQNGIQVSYGTSRWFAATPSPATTTAHGLHRMRPALL